MKDEPNARVVIDEDKNIEYIPNVGGTLKIRYVADKQKRFIMFNPAHLHVEFNGARIEFLQELKIEIDKKGFPQASLTFKLTELDIDMDSLLALKVIIENKNTKTEED